MLNLTQSQSEQLELSGISPEALEIFWRLFPECSFETAAGGVVTLLSGSGQSRTARFSDDVVVPSEDFIAASRQGE